jgi:hypothetical protein
MLSDATKDRAEFWRASVVLNGAEWQDVMLYLPPDHALRARSQLGMLSNAGQGDGRRRAFLAGGDAMEGTELWRGHHIWLT